MKKIFHTASVLHQSVHESPVYLNASLCLAGEGVICLFMRFTLNKKQLLKAVVTR